MKIDSNQNLGISFKSQFEEYSKTQGKAISMLTINAPKDSNEKEERAPIDLVCSIDLSGSMEGSKIDLVKKTLHHIVRVLKDKDRFGIVTFSNSAKEVLPLTYMEKAGKELSESVINKLRPDGWTNISDGIFESITTLRNGEKNKNDIRAVLLFTDGLANMGITDADKIVKEVNNLKNLKDSTPVSCSIHTFGFGSDHNSVMLKTISDSSNGLYFYIEDIEKIPLQFGNCIGGLISTVATNIKLEVEIIGNTKISKLYSGYRFETVENEKKYKIFINDLQEEERRDILFEISLPETKDEEFASLKFSLIYNNVLDQSKIATAQLLGFLNRKDTPKSDQKEDPEICENLIRFQSTEIINKATDLGKLGRYKEAKDLISVVRREIQVSDYAKEMEYIDQNLDMLSNNLNSNEFESAYMHKANAISSAQMQQRSAGVGIEKNISKKKSAIMSLFSK